MSEREPHVVFFGMSGAFSSPPLEALLAAGVVVRAVVMPALADAASAPASPPFTVLPPASTSATGRRALPLLAPAAGRTIRQIAGEHGIPVLEVARLRDPLTLAALAAFEPDAICVACFSRRLPEAVLRLPRLGCLNVHPSLLPDNRGPDPLFWTFQRGDAVTGATVHLMDAGLDSGPIVAQRQLTIPDGITEAALEQRCASLGGELLVAALRGLMGGTLRPLPQDAARATIYPWPDSQDYTITSNRSARWAYNFARGLAARAQPITIVTPDATFQLVAALDYSADNTLDTPWRLVGDELWLRCVAGVFHARIVPS